MKAVDHMLPFRALTIDDQPRLRSALEELAFPNSEMTFASLWMWRSVWMCDISLVPGAIYIREHQPLTEDPAYILPVLTREPLAKPLRRVMEDFHERCIPFMMRSVDEETKRRMEADCPGWFTYEPDESFFDYVYRTEDLIGLEGRKYHAKRNHIAKFRASYRHEYRELSSADKTACLELYDHWSEGRSDPGELAKERRVIADALENLEILGMRCGAITIDGKVEAFSLGERIRETAIIHIEKANTRFEGLYAMMNQQFAEHAWSDTTWINREEDMGIEGLRRAKRSYNPDHQVVKYIVYAAGEKT